jgi:hypothetical protein
MAEMRSAQSLTIPRRPQTGGVAETSVEIEQGNFD